MTVAAKRIALTGLAQASRVAVFTLDDATAHGPFVFYSVCFTAHALIGNEVSMLWERSW